MKKIFALLLALAALLTLAACDEEKTPGYVDTLELILDVQYREKYDNFQDLMPQEVWAWHAEANEMDVETAVEEQRQAVAAIRLDLETKYGLDIQVDYEIRSAEKIPQKDYDKILPELGSKFGLDTALVTDSVVLKFDLEVTGVYTQESFRDCEKTMIEYNGKWYEIFYKNTDNAFTVDFIFA